MILILKFRYTDQIKISGRLSKYFCKHTRRMPVISAASYTNRDVECHLILEHRFGSTNVDERFGTFQVTPLVVKHTLYTRGMTLNNNNNDIWVIIFGCWLIFVGFGLRFLLFNTFISCLCITMSKYNQFGLQNWTMAVQKLPPVTTARLINTVQL